MAMIEQPAATADRLAMGHDSAPERYQASRIAHWDRVARRWPSRKGPGRAYQARLQRVHRFLVAPGARVLEVGCGAGDLLAALAPAEGTGVDFSPEMLREARARHPQLTFVEADAHDLEQVLAGKRFDAIILSDLVNDLWDVQRVLEQVARVAEAKTRVILGFYSRVWAPLLAFAQRAGWARPLLPQNWLTVSDVENLLELAGLQPIRHWQEVLLPLRVPLLEPLCNRFLVRLWPFRLLALSNMMVARRAPRPLTAEPRVSVVVPARNEAGNVPAIFDRVPEMGAGTELIFVEGHSTDGTREAIERAIAAQPVRRAKLLRQPGRGKADAVRTGFEAATGEVLMILDADLTVPPEDLPRFYQAIRSGHGEFVNGVRLVYPMEQQAMRPANFVGNKFFSLLFSWLLGQPIKDTLCGTKVMSREAYSRLAANRAYFGDFDPFGDFDLLFGAAKLNLQIVEMPVRYRERVYGTTNIQRWRHGLLLLRMSVFAAARLKFF